MAGVVHFGPKPVGTECIWELVSEILARRDSEFVGGDPMTIAGDVYLDREGYRLRGVMRELDFFMVIAR